MQVPSFTDSTVSYTVHAGLNTCTCQHWKYQRRPVRQRTCKHLDSVQETSPSLTTYPQQPVADTYFQLVTHHIPTHLPANEYVYSRKYDGIRIRVTGTMATTRGGMTIDLTALALSFVDTRLEYDAELIHVRTPGHRRVMSDVNANRLHNLSVRVFDLIDTTRTFQERQIRIVDHVPLPYRVTYAPVYNRTHLALVVRDALHRGEEGVVVRRLSGHYEPGRRRRDTVFKVKKALK